MKNKKIVLTAMVLVLVIALLAGIYAASGKKAVEGAKAVYDMDKAKGKDAYEMFLSGNQPIITMRDPENAEGKRLILFRDSFGSSIAPLLMSGYSEIVLVDLRYVSSDMLGQYVDFENVDVLFLYSTLMLNNSLGMK